LDDLLAAALSAAATGRHAVSCILLLSLLLFDPGTQFPGNEKIRYAIQKSTKIKPE